LGREEEGGEDRRDREGGEMRMKGGLWYRLLIMFRLLGRMFRYRAKDGSLAFNVF
jgi:hypothetical protein